MEVYGKNNFVVADVLLKSSFEPGKTRVTGLVDLNTGQLSFDNTRLENALPEELALIKKEFLRIIVMNLLTILAIINQNNLLLVRLV